MKIEDLSAKAVTILCLVMAAVFGLVAVGSYLQGSSQDAIFGHLCAFATFIGFSIIHFRLYLRDEAGPVPVPLFIRHQSQVTVAEAIANHKRHNPR